MFFQSDSFIKDSMMLNCWLNPTPPSLVFLHGIFFSSQQLLFGEYVCLAILSFPYAFQTLGMAGGILSVSNFKSVSYSLSRF